MKSYTINNLYIFEKQFLNKKQNKFKIGKFKQGNYMQTAFLNIGLCLSASSSYYTRDELGRLVSVVNPLIHERFVDKQYLDECYSNLYDFIRTNEDMFSVNTWMNYFLNCNSGVKISKDDIKEIENYINKVYVYKK